MNAYQLLKDVSRHLPPDLQTRLRARLREHRAVKQRSEIAKWRHEILLAPRLPEYSIGAHTTGYPRVISNFARNIPGIIREENTLTIGDYCSISDGVTILLGQEHATEWLTTYSFWVYWQEGDSIQGHSQTKGDITIGNDVWIGRNSLVLSGTTIGDGAVIAPGSVVRGDIPAFAIAAGSPCRVITYRFRPDAISTLLALRWWDWPHDVVVQALPILCSDDIDGIVDFARRHSLPLDESGDATAVNARQLLKGLATRLPPSLQTRLQTRVRAHRAAKQRSGIEKRRHELLLAPRLPQYSIGPHSCGKPDVPHNVNWGVLTIGDYCSIAEGVTILLGNEHGTHWVTTYPFSALWPKAWSLPRPQATKGDVTIGNDVWIGTGYTRAVRYHHRRWSSHRGGQRREGKDTALRHRGRQPMPRGHVPLQAGRYLDPAGSPLVGLVG